VELVGRRAAPDVVVIDHHLPDQSAASLAGRIKAAPGGAVVPIVLLDSLAGRSHSEAGPGLFAQAVSKPVKRGPLIRALEEVAGPGPSREARPESEASRLAGRRVLLAEDNLVNQKVAVGLLQRLGVEVTVVGNGNEALESLRRECVDLVLMDCQMPELDGYEATRALRAGAAGDAMALVPVIALTASAVSGDRERCLEAGMTDYLTKPVRPRLLQAMVERYVHPAAAAGSPRADL
jgi:CheY-like chemotaxis protein